MAGNIAYFVLATLLMAVAIAALATVLVPTLLPSAVLLGLTSVCVAAVLFICGYQLAAVMELLVCTGLVTAILASAISLLNPEPDAAQTEAADASQAARRRLLRYIPLPLIVIALTVAVLMFYGGGQAFEPSLLSQASNTTAQTLWNERSYDVIGMTMLILAGVLGVTALIKQREEK